MLTSAPKTLRCYEEAHQSLYPMAAEQSPTSIHVACGLFAMHWYWAVKHWCHRISHTATWQWIVRVIAENSNKCEIELSHNNKKHNQTFSHRNQRYTKHINKIMRFKTKITSFSYIFVATNQDALTIHKLKWKAPYPIALFPFINTIVIILPKNATLLGKDDYFRKFYFYFKKIYW